jgi:nucleotidyltransferase AbiEii toxin of type IV toxin-antitoxin system
MKMTLEQRVQQYMDRGFDELPAQVLVLMEESAVAVFSALPERFILFGGATLVLFHASPRLSRDLDLLARTEALPTAEELQNALEERVQEVAGIFGLGPVAFEAERGSGQFLRLWIVGARKQRLFTLDLTRIGGSVLVREIVKEKIVGDEGTTWIAAPSRDYLLLQKAESLIARRVVKTRDAFDASLLLGEGATLKGTLRAHLNDALAWREFDRQRINERIEQITPRLCRAELEPVLPDEVYRKLEAEGFESLRGAIRTVFAEWL